MENISCYVSIGILWIKKTMIEKNNSIQLQDIPHTLPFQGLSNL